MTKIKEDICVYSVFDTVEIENLIWDLGHDFGDCVSMNRRSRIKFYCIIHWPLTNLQLRLSTSKIALFEAL